MRIAKNQIELMKICKKRGTICPIREEESEIAEYLVQRKFAKKERGKYTLTQEGKAYLYEFQDMRRQRYLTVVIFVLALIISIVSFMFKLV